MIRDRKMYVAPTPFALADGTEAQITLIVPETFPLTNALVNVGDLTRIEAQTLIVGYEFNLATQTISAKTTPNPSAGHAHTFIACRVKHEPGTPVSMRSSGIPS